MKAQKGGRFVALPACYFGAGRGSWSVSFTQGSLYSVQETRSSLWLCIGRRLSDFWLDIWIVQDDFWNSCVGFYYARHDRVIGWRVGLSVHKCPSRSDVNKVKVVHPGRETVGLRPASWGGVAAGPAAVGGWPSAAHVSDFSCSVWYRSGHRASRATWPQTRRALYSTYSVTLRRVRANIVVVEKHFVLHSVCVCSLRYPACNAPYCLLWPAPLCSIFPHFLINGTIFEKKSY